MNCTADVFVLKIKQDTRIVHSVTVPATLSSVFGLLNQVDLGLRTNFLKGSPGTGAVVFTVPTFQTFTLTKQLVPPSDPATCSSCCSSLSTRSRTRRRQQGLASISNEAFACVRTSECSGLCLTERGLQDAHLSFVRMSLFFNSSDASSFPLFSCLPPSSQAEMPPSRGECLYKRKHADKRQRRQQN